MSRKAEAVEGGAPELLPRYREFLAAKAQLAKPSGFAPIRVPDFLFPFQRDLLEWSLQMGRALLLADCGLGKTPISLAWADNVARHTGGRVLILTPLAVAPQFVAEGWKFGIPCERSRAGEGTARITVTNYEQLHRFNPGNFSGVVCDESSCIKNFAGQRRAKITEFLRTIPYRLLATATAAPNDFVELGTSAEALGYMGYMDMITAYFVCDDRNPHGNAIGARWRFKRAAEKPFWRWVCSWARAVRRPSDLGYPDGDFKLPPLEVQWRVVEDPNPPQGVLPGITVVAGTLAEQREERRRNLAERCQLAAQLVDHGEPAVIWTDLNAEADLVTSLVPDAVQVAGRMSDEEKERNFAAFAGGEARVMVTKPKIGAWGLNWQLCAHVVIFVTHSFEQYYQAVRRCWRFGQRRPVRVDIIATPAEQKVVENLKRKGEQADRMFDQLVRLMNDPAHLNSGDEQQEEVRIPSWLT